MRKAGHIARLGGPVCSPGLPLAGFEHSLGGRGQGFGSVRLYFGLVEVAPIHADQFQIADLMRLTQAGGGRISLSRTLVRQSHFFQYFADVTHRAFSSVSRFLDGNIDREDLRHAQKDFAFGAK